MAAAATPVDVLESDVVVGGLATVGVGLFVANMLWTIHRHGPDGVAGVLSSALESGEESTSAGASNEPDVDVSPDR